MCKSKKPKSTSTAAVNPAPTVEPVVVEQKDENKVAKKTKQKNSGTSSLRIDRTSTGGDASNGGGLNIPV